MSVSELSDCRGQIFDAVDLTESSFSTVVLHDATFRNCDFRQVSMRNVELVDVTIDGDIENLVINGVDVGPLIENELDRRYPDRIKFRPTSPRGFQEAWDLNEQLWDSTLERARRLPPAMLHESVDGEWSFIQTLRHLVFATQSWVNRCIIGEPQPWHPLSLPWDQMSPRPGVPHDRDARPSLEEVLALRSDAMATVRRVVDGLTDERLSDTTDPLVGPGWPDEGDTFPVRKCLLIVLNEEWWHRSYAERDLARLEERGTE